MLSDFLFKISLIRVFLIKVYIDFSSQDVGQPTLVYNFSSCWCEVSEEVRLVEVGDHACHDDMVVHEARICLALFKFESDDICREHLSVCIVGHTIQSDLVGLSIL